MGHLPPARCQIVEGVRIKHREPREAPLGHARSPNQIRPSAGPDAGEKRRKSGLSIITRASNSREGARQMQGNESTKPNEQMSI